MTILIILGAVIVYALGVAANTSFCGYMAGRNGQRPYAERKAASYSGTTEMTGWECLAAWSVVWPIFFPGAILAAFFLGAESLVLAYRSLFLHTQKRALAASERKKDLASITRKELV